MLSLEGSFLEVEMEKGQKPFYGRRWVDQAVAILGAELREWVLGERGPPGTKETKES